MTVVAIDFGTSNTVVCIVDAVTKEPRSLKFNHISRTFASRDSQVHVVPTLVYVEGQENLVVGEQVRSQRLGFAHPQRLFQGFKRDLAASIRPPARQIDGKTFTSEDIAEAFLTAIWQALIQQQIQPSQVIFTVPVGAFEAYLAWFRDFAKELNVPTVKLVDESTAAALGYAVQQPGSIILVIDFGGGTLDLSLVRTVFANTTSPQALKADVLAKSDAYIGGIDIDTWIVEYHLRCINSDRESIGEIGWLNLLEISENLKIRLSNATEARESWLDDENFISYEIKLTRDELGEILESHQLLEQLREAIDEILAIALRKGIGKSEIEQVLLVGGSCQIPAIQQLIISYFGRSRVKLNKPFEAVAHGAITLDQLISINDYLQHGYAIRLWEPYSEKYSYFPLFEKGMKYPCQRPEPLILQVANQNQTEIRLDIGEVAELSQAEVVYDTQGRMTSSQLHKQADFRSLIDIRHVTPLANIENKYQICIAHLDPPGTLGTDRIEVKFEVNDQRILLATVRDLLTQKILVERGAIAKLR